MTLPNVNAKRGLLLRRRLGSPQLHSTTFREKLERITRLAEIARDVPGDPKGGIRVRENGPYLVAGGALLSNFLGEPTTAPPVAALCRCGEEPEGGGDCASQLPVGSWAALTNAGTL